MTLKYPGGQSGIDIFQRVCHMIAILKTALVVLKQFPDKEGDRESNPHKISKTTTENTDSGRRQTRWHMPIILVHGRMR